MHEPGVKVVDHAKGKHSTLLRTALRVEPGSRVHLDRLDPADTFGHDKDASEPLLKAGLDRLSGLQDRLWAEQRHPVLVVLQGIDAAGKDGTIRHVMSAFNPQSCTVVPFGVPTAVESSHDYLWRIHQRTPGRGEITIFNRSHYESVLVVRVHGLDPQAVWSRRYDQINAWERMLADEGTTIVKFFLHISADEQRDRLQERVDDPTKRWKFRLGDLEERKRWGDYRDRLRGDARALLDGLGSLVCRAGQPQLVPQSGRGRDPGRRARRAESRLSAQPGPDPAGPDDHVEAANRPRL